MDILQNILTKHAKIENLHIKGNQINFDFKGTLDELSKFHKDLTESAAQIIEFFIKKQDIEDLFLQYTSGQEE